MTFPDVTSVFAASAGSLVADDGSERPAPEFACDAATVADWLRSRGVKTGDRVAIHMPNQSDYVRALLGCAVLGAVAVSVNTRYSTVEAEDLIERSAAVLVVRSGDLPPWSPRDRPLRGRADDRFVVFTTSGTTSRPKMVVHRQSSIAAHAFDVAVAFGYCRTDVVMVAMPLCGTFGLASLMGAVAGGARVVLTDFDTATAADAIARERVSCVNGSDDMFHRLLEHGADLSSIRLGGYARFNTSLDGIVERAGRAGATLVGLYGMSEVQALFALRAGDAGVSERERAGGRLVSPAAEYRVVDGELWLRGPSMFEGYLAEGGARLDPGLTAGAVDADGWFRTGDLASADDDRSFEYVTRLGDVLRLGGFLVSPSEIESVLTGVEGVSAAQVVAVDRPHGARPVAFVVLDGVGRFDEQDAIARCRERLAIHKVPVRVLVVDAFPSTPSANGTKIQKHRLRELAVAALD